MPRHEDDRPRRRPVIAAQPIDQRQRPNSHADDQCVVEYATRRDSCAGTRISRRHQAFTEAAEVVLMRVLHRRIIGSLYASRLTLGRRPLPAVAGPAGILPEEMVAVATTHRPVRVRGRTRARPCTHDVNARSPAGHRHRLRIDRSTRRSKRSSNTWRSVKRSADVGRQKDAGSWNPLPGVRLDAERRTPPSKPASPPGTR